MCLSYSPFSEKFITTSVTIYKFNYQSKFQKYIETIPTGVRGALANNLIKAFCLIMSETKLRYTRGICNPNAFNLDYRVSFFVPLRH